MRTGEAGKNQLIAKALREKGVLLCTYAAVRRSETLQHAPWHYVVLDEGHHIKNEDALVTKAVKAFQTPHRILLSGAPVRIIKRFLLHTSQHTKNNVTTGSEQSQGVVVLDGFRLSRTIGHSRHG